jgi:hypothetical protein
MNIELKDYFAGKAMEGMLSHNSKVSVQHLVMSSYYIANKMIEQKNKLLANNVLTTSKQTTLDNVENL